ncbi:daptide-type RiPP biosynthesis methyltransferase [Streptomyces chrestomyceticus]|uniref:daptide-type RiPP biosynthesis methyltransferase n=1 Tax=Streptomyces chrestomyceticus TaxID=68185 RepID=UPI0033DF508E
MPHTPPAVPAPPAAARDPRALLLPAGRALDRLDLPGLAVADLYDTAGAAFYDAFVGEVSADVVDLLRTAVAQRGPALDLACGSGRLTLPLAQRGLEVTAVDLSTAMLARLRDRLQACGTAVASRVRTVCADMTALKLGERYASVLLAATSIVLVPASRRPAFFAAVRRHLAPGGLFVFDYHVHDPQALARQPETVRVLPAPHGPGFVLSFQHFDLAAREETVNFYVENITTGGVTTRHLYTTRKQIFFWPELQADLTAAGLRVREHRRAGRAGTTRLVVCQALNGGDLR